MMKKIDKHGLNIKGLKKASGETFDCDNCYNELFYDRSTGEVWVLFQAGRIGSSQTKYHDEDIVKIDDISCHLTMQEIADSIFRALNDIEREKKRQLCGYYGY